MYVYWIRDGYLNTKFSNTRTQEPNSMHTPSFDTVVRETCIHRNNFCHAYVNTREDVLMHLPCTNDIILLVVYISPALPIPLWWSRVDTHLKNPNRIRTDPQTWPERTDEPRRDGPRSFFWWARPISTKEYVNSAQTHKYPPTWRFREKKRDND